MTFTAPQSPASDLYWKVVYITCPPWLIPESSPLGASIATPVLNAVLYASVVFIVYMLANRFRGSTGR